jgi:endonuclease III
LRSSYRTKGSVELPGSRKELLAINGIGQKTADYIAWLAGIPTVAVDRHIKRFCGAAGIGTRDIKKAVKVAAVELGVDEGCLDYSIWFYMSQGGKKGKADQ